MDAEVTKRLCIDHAKRAADAACSLYSDRNHAGHQACIALANSFLEPFGLVAVFDDVIVGVEIMTEAAFRDECLRARTAPSVSIE